MVDVKPTAWIGPAGQLMNHWVYEAWAPQYPDEAKHFRPLYGGDALAGLRELAHHWRFGDQWGGPALQQCADELYEALRALERKDSLQKPPT